MLTLLRGFPTEIENDLSRYHGLDIAEFWNGNLSARRLLVFIRHFPDDSATKKAMREGDWTEQEYVLARAVNELAFFRADHAAIHAQHKMRATPLESPAQRKERAERQRAAADVRSFLLAQLSGEYAPPQRPVTFESIDSVKGGPSHV